jgi:TfoX/Sxy family transcriptional regulator of competence genes
MGSGADETWRDLTGRLLASDPRIALKHAFSSPGLRFDDKIFAMLVKGELVVKLAAGRCEELASDGRCRPFTMGRREMREWAVIGPEREFEWDALADEALAYARRAATTSRP